MGLVAGCCRTAVVAGASREVAGEAGASKAEEVLVSSCRRVRLGYLSRVHWSVHGICGSPS